MKNRIQQIRESKSPKMSRAALAEKMGCGETTITKLERGERRLTDTWMERFAEALEVSIPELIAAKGEPGITADPKVLGRFLEMGEKNDEELLAYSDGDDIYSVKDGQIVSKQNIKIDELDVRAQAGHGAVPLDQEPEKPIAEWAMPKDWLTAQTSSMADRIKIIRVYGDSMVPEFLPGERVMVDLDDQIPSPPGIFVVWDGFGLVLKRCEIVPYSDPPTLRLISANKEYEAYTCRLDEASINGRVIGKWQWT